MARHVVTVFGGSGFLGRHLVRRLARTGAIVRVAVRDPEGASFLKPMGDVAQIVPIGADLDDPALVAAAVSGAETVINLVGILDESGRATFQRVHVDGAATIARAAAAAGARRLVHVSALGADAHSASAYARTKAAGEEAVRAAFPAASILRPSVVFGPEDNFFNLFAGIMRISPVLPVFGCPMPPRIALFSDGAFLRVDWFGSGGTRFQPVYVGDVADAIMRLLAAQAPVGRTYELGGSRVYSFKELMELLLAVSRRKRLLVPVPFSLAIIAGWFLQLLPAPLLTVDQVRQLRRDNVVAAGALTLDDLGIEPTAAEAILPTYLSRYRLPGRSLQMLA